MKALTSSAHRLTGGNARPHEQAHRVLGVVDYENDSERIDGLVAAATEAGREFAAATEWHVLPRGAG